MNLRNKFQMLIDHYVPIGTCSFRGHNSYFGICFEVHSLSISFEFDVGCYESRFQVAKAFEAEEIRFCVLTNLGEFCEAHV